MIKINYLKVILIIFFIMNNNALALEIINLAIINNKSITNYDLYQEIKIKETLENRKIDKKEHTLILKQMISEKIKKIECEKNKINVSSQDVKRQYELFVKSKLKNNEIPKQLKKELMNKIEDSIKWAKLINIKYQRRLTINMNEIEEIMKIKNIPTDKKSEIIQMEKNKKINSYSKTYYNEIKKNYLVKTFL